MSQNKPLFRPEQDDTPVLPEEKMTDAITQLNKHAADLQSSHFKEQNVSQYICDLLSELSIIASKANLVFLTYLIDVAHEEARLQSQKQDNAFF